MPVVDPLHGNIEPGSSQGRFIFFHFSDNFVSDDFSMTDIGAHPSAAGLGLGKRQGEGQQIPAEANHAGSRAGVLYYTGVLGHHSGRFILLFRMKA